jgi:membrane fusion protein (multidrug efflux system)
MVIGADNKVEPRVLQTSRTIGDNWLVTGGLKAGDKVIVAGGMMLRPGMPVEGKPWTPDADPAAAGGAGQGQPGPGDAPQGQTQAQAK